MNETEHISDVDLKCIIEEQATSVSEKTVEMHVTNCAVCQERMLALASDEEWRRTLARNYSDPDLLAGSASLVSETGQLDSVIRKWDEFDLNSVDVMLKQVLDPPTHPEMLGRIGRYDVESIIGCGGMGVVLKGFDRDLHRPIAIKMILPRLSTNGTAKQRFAKEARAAAVVLHPNIIPIFDIVNGG